MSGKLPPRLGIVILIVVASCFAANHLSARIAFDHGASVAAAVAVRASATALFLAFVLKIQKIHFHLPAGTRGAALIAGVLIAVQSYTLYSAVAIIPPALALLVFQTSPMLYVLLTWAFGKQKPQAAALAPMLLALVGLALALDIRTDQLGQRWSEIGAGVSWAFASGVSMAFVYFLNANALAALDGRLRTFVMTAVTATIVLVVAGSAGAMRLPADVTGAAGLASLTIFYCTAMIGLFAVLPRVPPAATAALNFEPIALLALAWIFLDQRADALQIVGAFLTVGAIAWLSAMKK
jgi:drug/metabolite transporter (DMT)-like permease